MKIAVIGSGIAGLSAAWFLRQKHEVSLYERSPKIGMDAHTAEIDCGDSSVSINVPMRVFFPEYYPTLTRLYEDAGATFEPVQYSGSFSHFNGSSYFRYSNYWLGRRAWPFLAGKSLTSPTSLTLGWELLRLLRQLKVATAPLPDDLTLENFLRREGYSLPFAEQFLYPTFAGICTCSYAAIKRYPAVIILNYLSSGLTWSKVNRLTHGTKDAVERLAASAASIHLNTSLKAIEPKKNGVEVIDAIGERTFYDHVIVATQANHALPLLPKATRQEKALLNNFGYETSTIVLHSDTRLAPKNQNEWAPVNFMVSAQHNKPMASILMNRIHPQLADKPAIFETWNPYIAPEPEKVLLSAEFERPVVTAESLRSIESLDQLHREPGRRVWFCGSYAKRGIPLLESAAASAKDIANRLNAMQS